MPKCRSCGNSYSFGASTAPPSSPTTNGTLSGVIGQFDQQEQIVSMNSWGAGKTTLRRAVTNPRQFFDICTQCGSQLIDWSDSAE